MGNRIKFLIVKFTKYNYSIIILPQIIWLNISPKLPLSAPSDPKARCSEHPSSELVTEAHTADFRESTSPKHPPDDLDEVHLPYPAC